ncbi:MAG: TetR/AcrR family transcriptional regulator [Pseudomonadota bacterium]
MSPRQLASAELQAREQDMVTAAFDVVAEVGVAALTLERLSQNLPYSKGTLYNHFTCKEDLLAAMCVASMETFERLQRRLVTYDATSRDRMLAMSLAYLLYAKCNPIQFLLVISAKSGQVTEKASDARRAVMLDAETRLMALPIEHIIQPALDSGECAPGVPLVAEQIIFSCWSNSFGAISLLQDEVRSCTVRQDMCTEREVLNSAQLMLDGLRWTPLSSEYDWRAEVKRAATTLYADELALLEARGTPFSLDLV